MGITRLFDATDQNVGPRAARLPRLKREPFSPFEKSSVSCWEPHALLLCPKPQIACQPGNSIGSLLAFVSKGAPPRLAQACTRLA